MPERFKVVCLPCMALDNCAVLYLYLYCSSCDEGLDSNQILHTDKQCQILTVRSPRARTMGMLVCLFGACSNDFGLCFITNFI